jgi:hypothetical protein
MRLLDELKAELKLHLDTIGVSEPHELNEMLEAEGEPKACCECADDITCEKKRIALVKLIEEMEK